MTKIIIEKIPKMVLGRKEEGRRKKEGGRRKEEEGRRQEEGGRRQSQPLKVLNSDSLRV